MSFDGDHFQGLDYLRRVSDLLQTFGFDGIREKHGPAPTGDVAQLTCEVGSR